MRSSSALHTQHIELEEPLTLDIVRCARPNRPTLLFNAPEIAPITEPHCCTGVLTGQFKAALVAVGYEGPPVELHGIRVEGYNNNKAANGEDVAAVQGLWMGPKSGGRGRYNRFGMVQVSNIPARMLGHADTYAEAAQPRRISRNLQPAFQAAEGDDGAPLVVDLASPATPGSAAGSSSSGQERGGDWSPGAGGPPAPGIMAAHLPLAATRRSPPVPAAGGGVVAAAGATARRQATRDALCLGVKGWVDFELGIPHWGPPRARSVGIRGATAQTTRPALLTP